MSEAESEDHVVGCSWCEILREEGATEKFIAESHGEADADGWMWKLPADDDRRVVLRLLNEVYAALDIRNLMAVGGDDWPPSELATLRDRVGDFLWPEDSRRPQDRWFEKAKEQRLT